MPVLSRITGILISTIYQSIEFLRALNSNFILFILIFWINYLPCRDSNLEPPWYEADSIPMCYRASVKKNNCFIFWPYIFSLLICVFCLSSFCLSVFLFSNLSVLQHFCLSIFVSSVFIYIGACVLLSLSLLVPSNYLLLWKSFLKRRKEKKIDVTDFSSIS